MENITLTMKEQKRVEVMGRVFRGELNGEIWDVFENYHFHFSYFE